MIKELPRLRKQYTGLTRLEDLTKTLVATWPIVQTVVPEVLRFLHRAGEIIWFDEDDVTRDTVVLDPSWLCWDVLGHVLAPDDFPGSLGLATRRGLITSEEFRRIRGFKGDEGRSIFPACLITTCRMCDVWPIIFDSDTLICARRAACVDKDPAKRISMLTAGFFPRLQARCYKEFSVNGELRLWRNRIHYSPYHGKAHLAVLLHDDMRHVDVWVQCGRDSREHARDVLHRILGLLEDVRAMSCPGTAVQIHAVDGSSLRQLAALSEEWPRASALTVKQLITIGVRSSVEVMFPDPKHDDFGEHVKVRDLFSLEPSSPLAPSSEVSMRIVLVSYSGRFV